MVVMKWSLNAISLFLNTYFVHSAVVFTLEETIAQMVLWGRGR